MKSTVPVRDLNAHLQGYGARIDRELSNGRRHVYFAPAMQKWIIVRRKGSNVELEFTADCPCSYDH
jgi:hypothetical protein